MSAFSSGVLKLAASRGLSLAIGLGTAPVVARLFTPEDFGVYGVIAAISAWLSSFACLGYFQALPLARDRAELRALIKLCLLLILVILAPALLIPWGGSLLAAWMSSASGAQDYLWFVPVLFTLSALSMIAENALSREERFGRLSLFNFTTNGLTRLFTISYGLLVGAGALGLLLGNVIGLAAALLIPILALAPIVLRPGRGEGPAVSMLQAAKRHSQFPKVQMWNWVLSATSRSLPVLILGVYFTPLVIGLFVYARNIVLMPQQVLSASAAQVFFPQGAREWDQTGDMSANLGKTVKLLALTTVFPIVLLGLLGPVLFGTVFGPRWVEAGVYAQIFAPWVLLEAMASPLSSILLITRRAHLALAYNLVLLGTRLGGLCLGGWLGGPRLALLLFSLGGAAVLLHQFLFCIRQGGGQAGESLSLLVREVLRALAALAPAALLHWLGGGNWPVLALAGAGSALHFFLLYRREEMVRVHLRRLLGWASPASGQDP